MEKNNTFEREITNYITERSPGEIKSIVNNMRELMAYYRCAILEVETKFNVLNVQFSLQHERNPIESIKTRLKSPDSIFEKLQRKNLPLTLEAVSNNLNDIAGVRVICSFVDDIYMLADCLIQQDDITLLEKKDYIQTPKENGYRSLHLIVEVPIFLQNEKRNMKVEVQLRTIAMESWANLEHKLRYKKELDNHVALQTSDALTECAAMSALLYTKMQKIRDIIEAELISLQIKTEYRKNVRRQKNRCFQRFFNIWWRLLGSNQRPFACEANALPAELSLHLFYLCIITLKFIKIKYLF